MALVHLVRHGRATGGWDVDPDPGIDALGRAQAEALAESLPASLAAGVVLPIVTSPMRRCRETARPLATRWGVSLTVAASVTEIPSPAGVPMDQRTMWLRRSMAGTYGELGPTYTAYRDEVVRFVRSLPGDTVVVSHFVAINAVIGACMGDDRVVIRSLDNASVTVVESTPDGLHLVAGGDEADTLIR